MTVIAFSAGKCCSLLGTAKPVMPDGLMHLDIKGTGNTHPIHELLQKG